MDEIIILGGGCAGLSLAIRLAAMGAECPKITIIESRALYENDRTWCFWGLPIASSRGTKRANKTAFDCHPTQWATHQWTQVMLKNAKETVRVNCAESPYQMLDSAIFYAEAIKIIKQNPRITLLLNCPVLNDPVKQEDVWHVTTPQHVLTSKMIIDTRPYRNVQASDSLMWQSFYGQEITCDEALFNPQCVTLMDFSNQAFALGNDSSQHVVFTYILPISANRALVEATVFSALPIAKADLTLPLSNAIAQLKQDYQRQHRQAQNLKSEEKAELSITHTVLRAESGVLPMGIKPMNQYVDNSYIHAGLFFGAARPSSGYAFVRIQAWAESCARAIAEGKQPIPHKTDSAWLNWMDTLFLNVMLHNPPAAGQLFLAMFKRVNTKSMACFMSDEASFLDYVRIIFSLPPLPFIQQLIRQVICRLQIS